ncbi:MAG: DUF2959 domain-containing protein [Marinobacterium sp.]|nr:DUF2959 domain-containing protein [Marinobacterium sp.]
MIRKLMLATALVALSGCQSAYYAGMEQVGVHKREILVDRVDAARDAQQETQEQFRDALQQFRSVVNFDGGELESLYERLQAEYDDSEAAAADLSGRIDKVEHVALALFDEWEEELEQYRNQSLKAKSASQLRDTRRRYKKLIQAMRRAEKRIQPVLMTLNDNVLYLKHNLNARAVGALKGELKAVQQQVDLLIRDMERSISESDQFIKNFQP